MSVSRHHADWLSLVENSGPFVSLPVLLRAFPQGLDPRDPEQAKQMRLAYEEWQENPNLAAKQRAWVMHVLTQVLLHPKELLAEGQTLPPGLMATMAEYGEILRPELALLGPTGSELAGKPQLLISLYPVEQSLDKPVIGKHWKATPGTRMIELLHATDVPLGLVTNGEEWMLVFAPRGDTTGFTSWYASLWIDEQITLRAFHSLLSTRRFFGVAPSDTLLALLKESAQDQQEVTNQLGDQVRDAVEVLIQAFGRLDQDSGRMLLKGLDEKSLYDAALTVMMRLVFLFSAEERGLLHLGESLYDDNYAVSTLREQLQEVADHYGEEVLERRHDGWARLLATFRAVHGGVNHQDLMLPAYGGSLFDPDRYPFLEGRTQGTRWQSSPAAPLEINNRVVLHLLKSLQMLQVKVPGGGPAEALRVSFGGLNIEQIGHVYEGLLDHTAVRAKEVVLGLAASRKKPVASLTLAELENLRQDDEAKLIELLEGETGRSGKALEKALNNGGEPEDFHKLLLACGQDKELAERIVPFRGLLRRDSFERTVVVLPGGIYVGQGSARRSTGTHYTPRSLTEPIIQYTLEPLVYLGPADGLTKKQWRLRSPKEILDLKVCDMAMGSGAFLVQACRYLSERLVEAWENLEKEHPGEVLITPEGGLSHGESSERLIPKEASERLAIARRLVADRCLYGVDINPMAVEMAKLSIWLITVDKSRPFTFLDHALKCGDSLLGLGRLKQLETFSLDDEHATQVIILSNYNELIRTATAKRRELETMPSNEVGQIASKKALLLEAEERLQELKLAADFLISAELTTGNDQKKEMARASAHIRVTQFIAKGIEEFRKEANEQVKGRRTFHWPLEFPETFERGGFDAFVGNPPFLGGKRITTVLGDEYAGAIRNVVSYQKGAADLAAYFMVRAYSFLQTGGSLGLVLTNSINEGDTRELGLAGIERGAGQIRRANVNTAWPGNVGITISTVVIAKGAWTGERYLNDAGVSAISEFLTEHKMSGNPHKLTRNLGLASIGTYVNGKGFVLDTEERDAFVKADARNEEVIQPYLTSQDINQRFDSSPSRYVINFRDLSEDEAKQYSLPFDRLVRLVKPVRDKLTRQVHETSFWKHWDRRDELYIGLSSLERALVMGRVSSQHAVTFMKVGWLPFDGVVVFTWDDFEHFALLQSAIHESWTSQFRTSLREDPRYSVSDCFMTFPLPDNGRLKEEAAQRGKEYYEFRTTMMASRSEGLTTLYNRFHDQREQSADVLQLRSLHARMDEAVAAAYDWGELDLGHNFHETKQGIRFTVSEPARRVVLDRLLALNHRYHDDEAREYSSQEKGTGDTVKRSRRRSNKKESVAQRGLY